MIINYFETFLSYRSLAQHQGSLETAALTKEFASGLRLIRAVKVECEERSVFSRLSGRLQPNQEGRSGSDIRSRGRPSVRLPCAKTPSLGSRLAGVEKDVGKQKYSFERSPLLPSVPAGLQAGMLSRDLDCCVE